MALNRPQINALLDVWEQCQGVTYAHRQCLYHKEHMATKKHEKCGEECKRIDRAVRDKLMAAVEELKTLYTEAIELNVSDSTLDFILYQNLPKIVFEHLYEGG